MSNAWAWRHTHSHLNCLITQGSNWDWDNCLLFMLLLCVVIEWETWCCGSTIIENSKPKTTKYRYWFLIGWNASHHAWNLEWMKPIWRTSNSDSCDVLLIWKLTFFFCPRNYCNNNKCKNWKLSFWLISEFHVMVLCKLQA